jgi:hypothetical protein
MIVFSSLPVKPENESTKPPKRLGDVISVGEAKMNGDATSALRNRIP